MLVFSRLPCSVRTPSRHSLNRPCIDRAALPCSLHLIGYLLLRVYDIIADKHNLPAPRPVKLNVFYLPRQPYFLSPPDRLFPPIWTAERLPLRSSASRPASSLTSRSYFPPNVPLPACVQLTLIASLPPFSTSRSCSPPRVPPSFQIESSRPLRYRVERPGRDAYGDCDVFAFRIFWAFRRRVPAALHPIRC